MPTYEYVCKNDTCDHTFEIVQGMRDAKLIDCPACSEPKLCRLIGGGNIVFKGDTWGDKERRREKEDKELFNRAKIARRLKTTGKIPKDAHVNPKDIDPDKYHGPAKLPIDHPERGTTSTNIANERGLE